MKKLVFALLLVFTTVSHAYVYMSNAELLDWPHKGPHKNYLIMYVLGIHDAYDGVAICTPFKTQGEALYQVVIDYAKSVPINRDEPAMRTVFSALRKAYPCDRKVPML